MEWIRDCFKPEIKHRLYGDYQMLIIDQYISHVSTKFIKFTRKHKIMRLCLPTHSMPLLQLLDINIFDFLKQNYKRLLAKKIPFCNIQY